MHISERIETLEQQMYVAVSDGDFDTVNLLENQIETLRYRAEHPFEDDTNALEDAFR